MQAAQRKNNDTKGDLATLDMDLEVAKREISKEKRTQLSRFALLGKGLELDKKRVTYLSLLHRGAEHEL